MNWYGAGETWNTDIFSVERKGGGIIGDSRGCVWEDLTHEWDYYTQLNDVCEHGFYCALPEFSSFSSDFGVV